MRLPWDSMANRPHPHRPKNRPIFQDIGEKEKKQKKELPSETDATSIGLKAAFRHLTKMKQKAVT